MVILLKCQETPVRSAEDKKDELAAFVIPFLCHLLDIFESDLTPGEQMDIANFISDWCKE